MSVRGRAGKTLLMAGALLALTAVPALPSGLELAWNQCYGQMGAVSIRTSACAVNTGSQRIIASFRPPAGINALEGIEVFVDYQVTGGVLPCWWNFAAGQLRNNQLEVLHVSPTDVNGNPIIVCDSHYFLDHGASGGGWMTVTGADLGHLRGIASLPAGTGLPVAAEGQQYGVGFRFTNGHTVPATSCHGCAQSACMVLSLIRLYSPGLPDIALNSPHPGSLNVVKWQGDGLGFCTGFIGPPPVPVLQNTWGAIKSIYR